MEYFYGHRNSEWPPGKGGHSHSPHLIIFLTVDHTEVTAEHGKYFLKKFITRYGNIIGDKPLTDEVFQPYLLVDSMKIHSRVLNALTCSARILSQLKYSQAVFSGIFDLHSSGRPNKNTAPEFQRRLITATAAVLLCITAHAQEEDDLPSRLGPFELQPRTQNPLREPFNFNSRPTPLAIDIDKDGDTDVVIADLYGGNGFHLLRNDGTSSTPAFNRAESWSNPFQFISFNNEATPAISDLDKDNDLDLFIGLPDGTFRYYKNIHTETYPYTLQSGAWNAGTKTGNPLYNIDLGDFTSPVFIDMDNDSDDDLVIGSSYAPNNKSMHYYINDGAGNFSPGTLTGINPNLAETTPAFIDMDADGDKDLLLGAANGNIYYYKRTGQTSFEEQTGTANPFAGINKGPYSSPSAADFDSDGDTDVILGVENSTLDIFYFENKGGGIFEEKSGFSNPFGGVAVISDSSPCFFDIDNDSDQDLFIGNSNGADPFLKYYKNENGAYVEQISNNPFTGISIPDRFVPSFIDLDGDGDTDLAGSVDNGDMTWIEYFKNENTVYVRQDFESGPFSTVSIQDGRSEFADIDNDGDFDLFVAEANWVSTELVYFIRYFKNTGTPQAPVFTEFTGTENPLELVQEDFELLPRLIDVDHDGDLDALIGEGGTVVETSDGNEFSYYENTGTPEAPIFTYRGDLIQQGTNPYEPAPSFVDQDKDGDLDLFIGGQSGELVFYINANPAAVATIDPQTLNFFVGAASVAIDPFLILTDTDNDSIVSAVVSIAAFQPGNETLSFTPQSGITGSFNNSTGVLAFRGKAPVPVYQALLRSVSYAYTAAEISSGRKPDPKFATIVRTITLRVSDADGTNSPIASKAITVSSGQPPVFSDHTVSLLAGASATVELMSLISDSDEDINLGSLIIVQPPLSGAAASIASNGVLIINYQSLSYTGTETLTLQACDVRNNCDQSTITTIVSNASIVVYNAVAPQSQHENTFFRIANLPASNKVSIFNRWGDVVYETEQYDNDQKRFEGLSHNDKVLPSGTYFYKIEYADDSKKRQTMTGYLSLKQ
jgi:gliding motility-associated-like protein